MYVDKITKDTEIEVDNCTHMYSQRSKLAI